MLLKLNKAWILSILLSESQFHYKIKHAKNQLFLTFDDGPHPEYTPKLLSLLKSHDVKATFFCIGKNIEKHPELAGQIHKEGHTLGNHSYTHTAFRRLSLDDQTDEYLKTETLLAGITGSKNHAFRAPQGQWNIPLILKLSSQNVSCSHWTFDSMDYLKGSTEKLTRRLQEKKFRGGEILLFHDDNNLAIQMLTTLIPEWKSKGFTFPRL